MDRMDRIGSENARPQRVPDAGEVARLAYGLYEQRGCSHGRDLEDWYRAEQMLRARRAGLASPVQAGRPGR